MPKAKVEKVNKTAEADLKQVEKETEAVQSEAAEAKAEEATAPVKKTTSRKATAKKAAEEKDTSKVAEEQAATKKAAEEKGTAKKAASEKAASEKAATKKVAEEKTATKRAASKKKEAVTVWIQYAGNEYDMDAIMEKVKAAYGNGKGIKELSVYVKPEEGMVYYVVNGDQTGSIAL